MGNAVTDDYHDYIGTFEYWWTHGLISDDTYRDLNETCVDQVSQHPSEACNNILEIADKEMGHIDPYSIYTPPCNNSVSLRRKQRSHYVSIAESYVDCVMILEFSSATIQESFSFKSVFSFVLDHLDS